jgi:5'-nucleotidase
VSPTRPSRRVGLALAAGALGVTAGLAGAATATASPPTAQGPKPVQIRLMSVNDFHGNLQPPAGSSGRVTLSDGTTTVNAGGAAYVATAVKQARSEVANSALVAAGDLIGASPLASALFHDEPTIDFFNYLGLTASAVGNHEFDEGFAELQRMQDGGCHPVDGCLYEPTFGGSDFPFLGSNVYDADTGDGVMQPYAVENFNGVKVGIIGATLKGVPDVVLPSAIEGLQFGDEAEAINRTSRMLARNNIHAQVVVMHQGDSITASGPGHGPNDCNDVSGEASTIAAEVAPEVDAIFTGHSHLGYNCLRPDPAGNLRPVTQGSSFGRLLTVLDLQVDRRTQDVIRSKTVAENRIVTRDVADAGAQAIVDKAVAESAPIANQQVGTITADIVRAGNATGESPLGDVIADGQLEATQENGAVVAMTNPGGIRTDLTYAGSLNGEGDGVVTYGEAFAVQPFSNIMQTITLTGAQLDAVLEQQWQLNTDGTEFLRTLQISSSLHYTMTPSNPKGDRVSGITINGTPVDPATGYRVSVNNFLASGGDGFSVFTQGTNLVGGPVDLDAFTAYLGAHSPVAPPALDRITLAP